MSIALLNIEQQQKFLHWLASMVGTQTSRLARMVFSSRYEFRKDKFLLSASYRKYARQGAIPRRVWNRHSALIIAMKGRLDRY